MKKYTIELKPVDMKQYRKASTVELHFCEQPFQVETQEGLLTISPDTVDDWEGGYNVAYPSDGSKPYPMSPKFARENYVEV